MFERNATLRVGSSESTEKKKKQSSFWMMEISRSHCFWARARTPGVDLACKLPARKVTKNKVDWLNLPLFNLEAASSKFFIISTEFNKNIIERSHGCQHHKNEIDFFMRLDKWPKIAVNKEFFFRNFRNKSCSILMLNKNGKNKKCSPKLISYNENFV